MQRTSMVEQVKVITVGLGSVVKVGDSENVIATADAFAVQRELPVYYGNEGDLRQIPFFRRPLHLPELEMPICVNRYNHSPQLFVSTVHITGLSAAAVLHIGSVHTIKLRSRIRHVRQFIE